ncbi:cobalt-precorrin-6A reductase [Actinoplanes sp. M2I2]|uniref:cobalt-precorrin-6A reductase n=1 Tax=Actinoplanes sp. M2I2 TaxID=1734444 RepID=UPI002020BA33|nr:cobalt-precorrin-6A reductase [Actinoplanes sp. M2I2]
MPDPRVLILGGTSEARALAGSLPGFSVISSLAGRTSAPRRPAGDVRVGGFGGAGGLAAYLRDQDIDVLVDATHPFAATISANAAEAAAVTGVPLVVLRRPGWSEQAGDAWHRVPDLAGAAALLPRLGHRVFLTTGRQGIGAFAGVDAWFLARSVEPPDPPRPHRLEVLLDRGPFTLEGERRLLAAHRIDVLVSKDSGGPDAKLVAARERGLPVIMVNRPPAPATARTVTSVAQAVEAVTTASRSGPDRDLGQPLIGVGDLGELGRERREQ